MRTEIEWAELHAPLFLNGTNLGQKLPNKSKGEVTMLYDEDQRHLHVTYKGKSCRIPETSVLSMVEAGAKADLIRDGGVATGTAFNPSAAQVSTPQSHVFAGAGAGLTGQEEQLEKIRQKPGPKPKAKA